MKNTALKAMLGAIVAGGLVFSGAAAANATSQLAPVANSIPPSGSLFLDYNECLRAVQSWHELGHVAFCERAHLADEMKMGYRLIVR